MTADAQTAWEQRVATPQPRQRGADGVYRTCSVRVAGAVRAPRLLPSAVTVAFEFREESVDDRQAAEVAALMRAAAGWLDSQPGCAVLGVAVEQGDERTSLWLTVEDAEIDG